MASSSTPKPSSSSSSSSASSSSSSSFSDPTPNSKFDVFLSFRGEDTRFSFTDHLFVGLEDKGIHTFRDHKLRRGGEIEQELLGTIEGSRFSVIVFSERYADSQWCLGELTKIMDCRKEKGQIVLPVFYHVDPSHVRKQSGCFEQAFARHETTVDGEKVKRWRAAMIEATNLGGWHVVKDSGYESKPIKEIIDFIFKRLKPKLIPVEEHMVGMNLRLEKLKTIININADDIRVVGIYGIGGIGKTTIAKMVYNDILCQFSGGSFLEDVKSRSKCHNGILQLLQEVLRDIQGVANLELSSISDGVDMIKDRLKSKKFLIVMDDVDHWDQVQTLIMSCMWFAPGSRIVITTRRKDLVDMCQMHGSSEVEVLSYEINALSNEEAVELFRWHAFKHDILEEDYINLSDNIVKYAQGHPLALKVLGSSLRGKTTDEWKSELDKLQKRPYKEINDLFRMSIDGLDYFEKEVLLDIACFFKGTCKDFATVVLDGCGLYATCGMSILLDRCLITVVHNKVEMHELIQQTCWAIVREEYPKDPSKWSRLWDLKDIEDAFSAKKMKNIETICLDLSGSKEIQFTSEVFAKKKHMFAKMKRLRLLKVFHSDSLGHTRKKDKIRLPIDFEFPPNIRYLHWEDLEFLPSNFDGRNIVAINLKSSNIKELWEEDKRLEKLKFIDLSDSQLLMKIPKLSSMPNLERLNLGGCKSFYEIHSSLDAFPKMKFLKELDFSGSRIKELPSSIGSLTSLEILNLSECLLFEKFADIFENMGHLRILDLEGSGIRELPNSIGYLESLETLQLSNCSKFEKFPEIHGNMKSLRDLSLGGTPIKELPNSIGCLGALESLSIWNCSNLDKLPEVQSNMGRLVTLKASESAIKELPISICHLTGLKDLYLCKTAIKELPCSIGHLGQLKTLDLQDCRNLASLPSSIYKLKSLRKCSLNGCSDLKAFWEITEDMEHLERLCFRGVGITVLPSSIEHLKNLTLLELNNCGNLETLPNSITNLTRLRTLLLHNYPKLHKLPDGLRSLQCCLEALDISCCNLMEEAIPSDLWCLFSLVMLNLSENNIRCIPVGIIHLSCLKILLMNHCHMLQEIPELPSSLRRIEAHGCPCLETISSDSTHLLWSCLLNCFKSQIQDFVKRTYIRERDLDICVRGSHRTNVIIPGSCGGIPEWVSHKSMGREIIIDLPKNWYKDKNFLGFALFFHQIPLDDDDDICKTLYYCFHSDDYDCKCKKILDTGHLNDCGLHVNIPQFSLGISDGYRRFEQVEIMSFERNCKSYSVNGTWYCYTDHNKGSTTSSNPALRVAYFPQIAIKREHRSNGWNKFQARFQGPFDCGDKTSFKVESCGIHLIYDDDDDDAQDDDCQPFGLKRGCHDAKDHLLAKRSRQV